MSYSGKKAYVNTRRASWKNLERCAKENTYTNHCFRTEVRLRPYTQKDFARPYAEGWSERKKIEGTDFDHFLFPEQEMNRSVWHQIVLIWFMQEAAGKSVFVCGIKVH